MGMFDSLHTNCPRCKKDLEFQSKSGSCSLDNYTKYNLPPDVAIGMDGLIIKCEFCGNNYRLKCFIPKKVKITLIKTKKEADYSGNYNPALPENIKRIKEFSKELGLKMKARMNNKYGV